MYYIFAYGKTLPETYHKALVQLQEFGDIKECKAYDTHAIECAATIEVSNPIAEPRISRMFPGGPLELEQYRQEIVDGILDFEIDKGNWRYTYHDRMFNWGNVYNQIDYVVKTLRDDPSSRRAVIDVRHPSDVFSDSPACLQHIQYIVDKNKLDCFVLFRSNDAVKATFMNAFALICLQELVAKRLGLEVGKYVHTANSFHCYERDLDLLEAYVLRIEDKNQTTTYNYSGEWDELMMESRQDISEKIKALKSKKII